MKLHPKHPHVDAVCAILRAIGAEFTCQIQRRVVIWYRLAHRTHRLSMAATPRDPEHCARHACCRLGRQLRELGYGEVRV